MCPQLVFALTCCCASLLCGAPPVVHSFSPKFKKTRNDNRTRRYDPSILITGTELFKRSKDKGDDAEAWDANVDYNAEWPLDKDCAGDNASPSIPDPATAWDVLPNIPADLDAQKLGIDLAMNLEPMTAEQVRQLQQDASRVISDAIDVGIQDIETLRSKMNREIEASKRAMQLASDLEAKQQQEKLLSKIDKLTSNFLQSNEQQRKSSQLAYTVNRAMEGTGRGLEMGTWGILDGKTVLADNSSNGSVSLLGSVENAMRKQDGVQSPVENGSSTMSTENGILLVADTKQDPLAKRLVPALIEQFKSAKVTSSIPNLQIEVLSPTSIMPIGGNNAACVIVFCTSLSLASSANGILDRLLRKTLLANNQVGSPPTQLVAISTLGTERLEKFPYNMQNLMGGKLKARRQIEEALINVVRNRVTEPPLDYSIVKLNADKFGRENDMALTIAPGDVLDDPTTVETAALTVVQAVAYQPYARNATFSISGSVLRRNDNDMEQDMWQELFLCLDGPEVWRSNVLYTSPSADDGKMIELYVQLAEYLKEWGDLLASSGKELTTPIRSIQGVPQRFPQPRTILRQDGVQLLFLPTATGKNYMSREEEKERNGASAQAPPSRRQWVLEGGIDVVIEVVESPPEFPSPKQVQLRVRARRCNYADGAVIKELSEETIKKRLEDALKVWAKEQLLQ